MDELNLPLEITETGDKVYSKNEGYSVTGTGIVTNLESHQEANQKKSDEEINIHEVSKINASTSSVVLSSGAELLVNVEAMPFIANCPEISWYSSDENVAIVDDMMSTLQYEGGRLVKIIGVGAGTTIITAVSEGSKLSCSINVEVVAEAIDTETASNSFDFIHDKSSWEASYASGGLKMYYEWSDRVNKPYKEDLLYTDPETGETRAASLADAKKDPETGEYILDENGSYIYENCTRCWEGALAAPGSAYPWIVPYFNTNINSKIRLEYEGLESVMPWGNKVFGSNKSFGCASVSTEFNHPSLLLPECGNPEESDFDITKFRMILIHQE